LKSLRLINCCRKSVFAAVFVVAIVYAAQPSVSDDFTQRRITAGAKIFRALLAADVDIVRKTCSRGELRLCLLYIGHTGNAETAAAALDRRGDSRIRKMKINIEILSFAECLADDGERLAGLFLTQKLNAEKLQALTAFARERHTVVFSPFEGDVERGVQSGIAVEARVRPYLNIDALRAAKVRLKSFFLKVAKVYD
jgi:hypothetical protein